MHKDSGGGGVLGAGGDDDEGDGLQKKVGMRPTLHFLQDTNERSALVSKFLGFGKGSIGFCYATQEF